MSAGNAVIGALRVVLGADTAALEKGLKDAQSSLAAFGSGLGKSMLAAGAAVAAAAGGMAIGVKSALNDADKLGKMAQSIGVPVEQLSALKYAADLSDVSLEALGTSLGKMSKNMAAAVGGAGPAANAFRAIGVSLKNSDGSMRSSDEVLGEIAEKFKGYQDGAAKTALAIALFGKAGAAMIPLLNQGRDGLAANSDEAKRLGLVLTNETSAAAEQFNDNLKRLHSIITGVFTQVAVRLAPVLQDLSDQMFKTAEGAKSVGLAIDGLTAVLKGLLTTGVLVSAVLKSIASFLAGIISAATLAVQGEFTAALEGLRLGFAGIDDAAAEAKNSLNTIWKSIEPPDLSTWEGQIGVLEGITRAVTQASEAWKVQPPVIEGAKNALQKFIDTKNKQYQVFQAEYAVLGQSNAAMEKAKFVAEALAAAHQAHIPITEKLIAQFEAMGQKFAAWNEKATFGKQIFEQTRSPAEQFAATIERLNLAFDNGKTYPEVYARAIAQAQDKLVQANVHAQNLGNALENTFSRAIDGGMNLKQLLASFIKDLAKMEMMSAFRTLLNGNSQQGGTFGGILTMLFGGPRAKGGPVTAGVPYLIGERGPEMFVPKTAGQVISNRDLASAAGSQINIGGTTIVVQGDASEKTVRMIESAIQKNNQERIVPIVRDAQSRGHL